MQDKKLVLSLFLTALIISATAAPSAAFIYPDGSQNNSFDAFGPHIDKLLIKKYPDPSAEMAALQAGEIDIADWVLNQFHIDIFATDPNVRVLDCDGNTGFYTFSFNLNNNLYLGNPPDPAYPNPENPNPQGNENPTSNVYFRQAISHLIDRVYLSEGPGAGLFEPIFTPMPAYMDTWIHPDIKPGGALEALTYPPGNASAAAILDANGFPLTGSDDGYRYWDRNSNSIEDAGEDLVLDIVTRLAPVLRVAAGDMLCAGLDSPLIKIKYVRTVANYAYEAYWKVMVEKDYNMYTSGWIYIGPDPDYLFDLYNGVNYWHSEDDGPPNYGFVNDSLTNTYSENTEYATNTSMALTNCLLFQERFAEIAAEIPLGTTASPKAYRKSYVGTGATDGIEDAYEGAAWTHIVNEKSVGVNSWYTTLNAYPVGHEYGAGDMTMRYGWYDNTMPQTLNPLYVTWTWESEVIGRIYDCLGRRDPMAQGPVEVPLLAQSWKLGTWLDPSDGKNKTSIEIRIRSNVMWSDDEPFDVDDIIYTFVDLPAELAAVGAPEVWWQSVVDQIAGVSQLDDYRVEIRMKDNSTWSANSVLGNIIVPKHLWRPFIAANDVATISGDLSNNPTMLTGTGPFKFVSNDPDTLLMIRNPIHYYQNPLPPSQSTTVYIDNLPSSIEVGQTFDVNISVSSVSNLWAWQVGMQWDPNILEYVSFSGGDFQSLAGYSNRMVPTINSTAGKTLKPAMEFAMRPSGGVSAPTIRLMTMTMKAIKAGASPLSLINASLKAQDPTTTTIYPRWSDTNGDEIVDIFDVVKVLMPWDSGTYNQTADFNDDEKVDLTDIAIVTSDFAKFVSDPDWGFTTTIYDVTTFLGDGSTTVIPTQVLSVDPLETMVTNGMSFILNIDVGNVADIYAFDVRLYFNTTLLQAIQLDEGPFLGSGGDTFVVKNLINETGGYVRFASTLLSAENGVSGAGTLFSVTFATTVGVIGNCSVTFGNTILSDSQANPIDHVKQNGTVVIYEVQTIEHPVTVNQIEHIIQTVSNSTVSTGENFVYNDAEKTLEFSVTGPPNTQGFCDVAIPKELMSGTFAVLVNGMPVVYIQTENTTHCFLHFTYNHSTDNIEILLTIPGDLNGDRRVDIFDLVTVAVAYDSTPDSSHWNPVADARRDGLIDIFDIVIVAKEFGKEYSP
jgi:ABC-type transport system substrate-binding protein